MICVKCEEEKGLEFYKNDRTCKECRRAAVTANRIKKAEYYREYDRARANRPERIQARKDYAETDAGKQSKARAAKKWQASNPIKRAANIMVGNAVRDGRLSKPVSCEECGASNWRIHGHHEDYSLPLSVRWLCSPCHTEWHRENGPGKNAF